MRKFEADTWYEPIRLGKGTITIIVSESKWIVGHIVTASYNSQYNIQCEQCIVERSEAVHVDKIYIVLVWTNSRSRPSLANIITLAYHQRMKFAW